MAQHKKRGRKPTRREEQPAGGAADPKVSFLDALAETANVCHACNISSLPRRTAYNWRESDQEFAKAWDAAMDLGTDALEDEAVRRAVTGVDKPIFQGGQQVGTVREYSDTLLIFLLKGRRPEKYRERVLNEVTGPAGGNLVVKILGPGQSLSDL